jgi:selenocysteine lyase/cysteine desulfurase
LAHRRWFAAHGESQRAHEAALTKRLIEGIENAGGYRVLGPGAGEPRVPVVALVHQSAQADQIAYALDKRYGIAVRSGLHCAPWAHRSLGTLETGALRLSIGYGLTQEDVDLAIEALSVLGAELADSRRG